MGPSGGHMPKLLEASLSVPFPLSSLAAQAAGRWAALRAAHVLPGLHVKPASLEEGQ